MRGLRGRLRIVAVVLILLGIGTAVLFPDAARTVATLPLLAFFSVLRMVAAYVLSLLFAISYGHTAATNRRAATVMLPVMDILQSIPILGFFPFVLLFFVNGPLGDPFGIEVAAVFLIFTSMAWNMAFGVYESITTLPQDLDQAARSFGLHGWLRFRLLALPAMVPKLIYNSILSWTNGWFFLVASEIITSPGTSYVRPGLGSFIYLAGQRGDIGGIAIGIAALATVVLLLDVFLWRPMSVWSERFRMETTATGERASLHVPSPYERLRWLPRFPRLRREVARRTQPLVDRYARSSAKLDRVYSSHQRVIRAVRRADIGLFLIIFVIVVATGLIGLVGFFQRPLPSEARGLPIAAAFSFLRLLLAYLSALAWTIPVAAWLGRSKWAARFVTPVFEISASIPATALQPLIIGFAVAVTMGGYFAGEIGAYLVSLFAMQWYLLFNLIAGVRSIPGDLDEAARAFGLRGRTYWRRLLLPALVPSLATGSITAWGAGWNALIVAEYLQFGRSVYSVTGLGASLFQATVVTGNYVMGYLTVLAMTVVVLTLNKLLWRPIYKRAAVKYRMDV